MKVFIKATSILSLLVLLTILSCDSTTESEIDPVDYVNPYMGNISHMLVPTYPTVHLPNSMLRVIPSRDDYTSVLLKGLPLITTSHRGRSAFNLSPFQGKKTEIKPVINYSYDLEQITPYSYSVFLDEQQTDVNLAVSHQSAIYKFEFGKSSAPFLILNTNQGELNWDGEGISGKQQIGNNTFVYIYLKPEIKPQAVYTLSNNRLNAPENNDETLVLEYDDSVKILSAKYGVSFIDAQQAKANLSREIKDFVLEKIKQNGRKVWNETLGKMKVEGGLKDDRVVFYTSLYRTFERPVCISEDGRYFSAFDGKIHDDNGIAFYTDDWIWDSYRAHHPLNVLIDPLKEEKILNSFVRMAEQMDNFWMPTFPEVTGDSRRMNSNHGVAAVLDAYRKGIHGFDLAKAYEACKNGITEKTLSPWSAKPAGRLDQFYKVHGYFPSLKPGESETEPEVHSFESRQPVAVTLGTSYDEWCLAQIAKELGLSDDNKYFSDRSYNYRKIFNNETGFFHPKDEDGKFIEPFDYRFSGGLGARQYYDENNGWTYRWDVQHNIADLIDLMGGNEKFTENLDAMFAEPMGRSKFQFYAQLPDQTGNVGQFTMANEPSLHIPYLYNYAGKPWKTQKVIRKLLKEWFRNDLMGVPGDEDGGGMSAFVVFSMLGFYPVTPGLPMYNIGSPHFDNAVVDLGNGKTFEIITKNNTEDNKYIQSVIFNGNEWNKPWFTHQNIMNGGKLVITLGNKANQNWGSKKQDTPPSFE